MFSQTDIHDLISKLKQFLPVGYYVGLHYRRGAPIMRLSKFPLGWLDFYYSRAYSLRDPLIGWGLSTSGSTRWSALPVPDLYGVLSDAARFGMAYGVSVSVGPINSRTIGAIARNDREYYDDEIDEITKIIRQLHASIKPPEGLTRSQIEALRCVADGDRHAAAAAKLGISESAFKARLISARQRLMARTTAEALQRAKEYGFL